MFKIVIAEEERRGNPIMKRVQGNAVAKIFNYDSRAILMERAIGEKSLAEMLKTVWMIRQPLK